MDRIDWMKGQIVPADLIGETTPDELDEGLVEYLVDRLRDAAASVPRDSDESIDADNPFGLILARNREGAYRLYYGKYGRHSHPASRTSPFVGALCSADTEGFHSVIAAVLYRPGVDLENCFFSGVVLETLAEHFPRRHDGDDGETYHPDMVCISVNGNEHLVQSHKELLPKPAAGSNRPTKQTVSFEGVERLDGELLSEIPRLVKRLNSLRNGVLSWLWFLLSLVFPAWIVSVLKAWILPAQLSARLVDHIKSKLVVASENCTGDGETRPGRKRHSVALLTSDGWVVFGVNQRSSCDGVDTCSELRAIQRVRISGKLQQVVAVVLYSPDYPEGGSICVCGRCRDGLGDCLHNGHGDMLIVYINDDVGVRQVLLSQKPMHYHQAEANEPML